MKVFLIICMVLIALGSISYIGDKEKRTAVENISIVIVTVGIDLLLYLLVAGL